MTPERWHRVKELFRSALEHESGERDVFLDQTCKDDEHLRLEVESLLASYEESDHFIETPLADVAAELFGDDQSGSLVGRRLAHYEIVSLLGEGGMGAVYLARDTKLGRKLALKLLPSYLYNDADRLRRFEQEACAASSLNHPNIITIHEIGAEGDTRFIATEYIEGETLRQHMTSARMEMAEVLDIAMQIASALAAAHEAGIVHRDIKPENIMLRRDRLVKVLDFGLAKLTLPQTAKVDTEATTKSIRKSIPGVVMGTARYMSPEQSRGLSTGPQTDIWSLGCVLYEMVAGRGPFEGETTSDVIAAILERQPLPLARYAPDVASELEWIVRKALRKDQEERYQTAKGLFTDLKTLKQRLEFEAELGRNAMTERGAVAKGTASGEHAVAETAEAITGHPTTSAEYLSSQIKQHKFASLAVLLILLLAIGGLGFWYFNNRPASTSQIESIAVLPFQNATGNSDSDYLSDGVSEALINSLTELRQLKVIARSTAFRYKGREVDPQTVGRELNVGAVLMGRVRQMGDRLSVQVDLVDAATGAQLWGEEYERKISDILPVKQAIAREITEKLRLRLSGEEQQRLVRSDTTRPEAYQLYLRGRFHWNKRTVKELSKSIEYFQQAVTVDPNYAHGYAGLADAYTQFAQISDVRSREVLPKARDAAVRALLLDDELADAHAAFGLTIILYDYDFAGAESELKRAIELNPNYGTAYHYYGRLLSALGRHEEAFAVIHRALEIDSLSLPFNWFYGHALIHARKYDESIAQLKKTQELDPTFPGVPFHLARVYQAKGSYAESVEEYAKYLQLSGQQKIAALARESFAKGGWQGYLRVMVERGDLSPLHKTHFYAALGEKDKAFDALNKAYEDRDGLFIMYLKVDPRLDPLRADPRFQDLLRRVGFSQ